MDSNNSSEAKFNKQKRLFSKMQQQQDNNEDEGDFRKNKAIRSTDPNFSPDFPERPDFLAVSFSGDSHNIKVGPKEMGQNPTISWLYICRYPRILRAG